MTILDQYKKDHEEMHNRMMRGTSFGFTNFVNTNRKTDSIYIERGNEGFAHILMNGRDLRDWFEMTYSLLGYHLHKFSTKGISNTQPWILLQHIEVVEDSRRSGLGTLLLRDIEARAKETESHIALVVKSGEVEHLHDFYQKNGYQQVGSIGYYKKYRR